jgi:hypothetical protein
MSSYSLLAIRNYEALRLLHRLWRFRNSRFFRCGVVSPNPNPQTTGPETTLRLTWMALSGAYAPANIALRVIGARKPPLHDKAVVLEENAYVILLTNF